MIKQGDRVKFLNDVGEGIVVSIIDKKTVMVKTEDEFDVPVLMKDLIVVESGRETREETINSNITMGNEEEIERDKPDENSIITDDEIVYAVQLENNTSIVSYLVNSSSYYLYYTVGQKKEGEMLSLGTGKLEPDTKVSINEIHSLNVDEKVILHVNILFYGPGFYKAIQPLGRKIEFLPSDIYSGIILKENDYLVQKAAVFNLYNFKKADDDFSNKTLEGDLSKLLAEKKKNDSSSGTKAQSLKKEKNIIEVDLHIHEIVDDYKHLSNGEIIDIQLSRFKTSLETAIIHKNKRIVFIHGVGNGKLKFELRKKLDKEYPKLKYQDASFKEYGYGATMVIL